MIAGFGGLWVDAGSMMEVGDVEISAILREARASLVARMIHEVPFPPELDEELFSAALNAYAEFARSIAVQWMTDKSITRSQAHVILAETLRQIATRVVPAAQAPESVASRDVSPRTPKELPAAG
jgi:hypothetical protein